MCRSGNRYSWVQASRAVRRCRWDLLFDGTARRKEIRGLRGLMVSVPCSGRMLCIRIAGRKPVWPSLASLVAPEASQAARASQVFIVLASTSPACWNRRLPRAKTAKLGMPWTLWRAASSGNCSLSTLRTTARPARSRATCATMRRHQGPLLLPHIVRVAPPLTLPHTSRMHARKLNASSVSKHRNKVKNSLWLPVMELLLNSTQEWPGKR
jgi:hypothetical protein